jgi:hypothetical protein
VFQGIYSYLSKYHYFVKEKIINLDEKAKYQEDLTKEANTSNITFILDEQPKP